MGKLDYKDWIQCQADEIAEERYKVDFYNLPTDIQLLVWAESKNDFVEYESARIDAMYDAAQEREAYERWKEARIEIVCYDGEQ